MLPTRDACTIAGFDPGAGHAGVTRGQREWRGNAEDAVELPTLRIIANS